MMLGAVSSSLHVQINISLKIPTEILSFSSLRISSSIFSFLMAFQMAFLQVPSLKNQIPQSISSRVCGPCSCFKVLIRQYQHLVSARKYTKMDVNTLRAHIYQAIGQLDTLFSIIYSWYDVSIQIITKKCNIHKVLINLCRKSYLRWDMMCIVPKGCLRGQFYAS